MQRHTGEFVTVTDQVLSLQEGGADVSIKRGATFSSFPHLRLAFGAFQVNTAATVTKTTLTSG
jgi:hypothetical protein